MPLANDSEISPNIPLKVAGIVIIAVFLAASSWFVYELKPVGGSSNPERTEIKPGDGFLGIADGLKSSGLIRSALVFKIASVITGSWGRLKPGVYELNPTMSSPHILKILLQGREEIEVMIPEGSTVIEIDKLLSDKGILPSGALVSCTSSNSLEGKLFPDTYRFFKNSATAEVIDKFLINFKLKAGSLLSGETGENERNLILASLIEKEVPDFKDRQIVAGILIKRLKQGIPLQVDSSICYVKELIKEAPVYCYPLTALDLKIKSPYNTYLNRGLPPGPIGNPGLSAISAALTPLPSSYLYYLSDPATGKTIFSLTLDEHYKNSVKYLVK